MDAKTTAELTKVIEPMATEVGELFIKAMLLRINVHISLGMKNGAEPEDFSGIVMNAIDSSQCITTKFFDDIGEVTKALTFTKKESS